MENFCLEHRDRGKKRKKGIKEMKAELKREKKKLLVSHKNEFIVVVPAIFFQVHSRF